MASPPSTSSSSAAAVDDWPPWSRFSQWIHSVCVVTFDLELGQALEVMYPGDAVLSSQEKSNICYLAFPDSNSGANKDTKYHFRIRRSTSDLTASQQELLARSPATMPMDAQYLFGFVHFRQQRAPHLPRGYYQKSVVIVSILPFFHLMSAVVEKVALGFFDMGEAAIEAACHDMDHWPVPKAGHSYELPLMGSVIQPGEVDGIITIPSVYDQDIYKNLSRFVSHMHLLWELVLLGEPILVIANGPTKAATIVQSLVSIIAPLKYSNDYRPYFTIHDSEFREYTVKTKYPARILLGVTNPFFVKALDHWPHILKVSDHNEPEDGTADTKQEKTRKHWDGRTLDAKAGLFTQHKSFLHKDDRLLKKLAKERPDDVHSAVLQRHLLELTQSFMIPLERYLSTLMPLRKEMSPFKSAPSARTFSLDDFLATLDEAGPSLTCGVKGDWTGLYRRFIHSRSFAAWLSSRWASMAHHIRAIYVDALCETDLGRDVLAKKHNVEIVDVVLRLRSRLVELDATSPKRPLLAAQIRHILDCVDDELKSVLLSNCELRDIIS